MENVLDQTAITYPYVTLTEMTGAQIKQILEDVCDNLFNPDPYYQQGGDMVRVGGLAYSLRPDRDDGQAHRRHGARTASRSRPGRPTRSRAGRRFPKRRATPAASRSGTWWRAICAAAREETGASSRHASARALSRNRIPAGRRNKTGC